MAIYIDGDACPVKAEVYKVAARYDLKTFVVADAAIFVPTSPLIEMVVVKRGFDAADDWIAENSGVGDVVITSDIPLAERCLAKGARVIGPKGKAFSEDSIGEAMATRALMDMLRQRGEYGGGPAPFAKEDRSRFLGKLDETIHAAKRDAARRPRPPG